MKSPLPAQSHHFSLALTSWNLSEAVGMLRDFETATGHKVTWGALQGELHRSLPQDLRMHANPFCSLVKSSANGFGDCLRDDVYGPVQDMPRKPWIKRCHAGVMEVAVPVGAPDLRLGALYCGPFRLPTQAPKDSALGETWKRLPAWRREKSRSLERLLQLIAERLVRLLTYPAPAVASPSASLHNSLHPAIHAAQTAVRKRLSEPLRAQTLARECGLSASRFIHLFKEQTGQTFSEYLTGQRVERARFLLEGTDLRLEDIAQETGFVRSNYLCQVFKRWQGITPAAFRRKSRLDRSA